MMKKFFDIRYEFSVEEVHRRIDEAVRKGEKGYICVADGNILQMVHNDADYRRVVDGALFSICDSSWVPKMIRRLYGEKYRHYTGSDIFRDITEMKKYRQLFLGSSQEILDGLRRELTMIDTSYADMRYEALPYCRVEEFDYEAIAKTVRQENPDIIWVGLGAPKQERFMSLLLPHIERGVMIAVGAVFNFRCGLESAPKRAPQWVRKCHLEFVYRLFSEPDKQWQRCKLILNTLPAIYKKEKNI
jgi:N-acetylglucosaminyldiphosphoundecaprenol N-acetyl-beta-D-mannosaminyltransferase